MVHSVLKELVFPFIFPHAREVFWVLHSCFFLYFPLNREVFEVLFLCFEILLYIFPVLPLRGLGFLKESDLCGAHEYSRTNIS